MEKHFDAIVVLGGPISAEGIPGRHLRLRLEHAVELHWSGVAQRIICCGHIGLGKAGTRLKTEAEAMKDFLVAKGIPSTDILLEERSRDTFENIFFLRRLFLEPNKWRNIAVITNTFHEERVELTCQKILGPTFQCWVVGVPDGNLSMESEKRAKELLEFTKESLKDIEDGNMTQVTDLLCNNHPISRAYTE